MAVGLCLILSGVMFFLSSTSTRPANLGVSQGKLSRCPASPNCVCSGDPSDPHYTPPFAFKGPADQARSKLAQAALGLRRATRVEDRGNYLAFEFRSALFRFVDDVEFLIEPEARQIQVRSASRAGYSDLGVNRSRVEEIRKRFASLDP